MEGAQKRIERPTVALEDVKTPEDFLNAVDFKTLNELVESMVLRAGPNPDKPRKSLALTKKKVRIHLKPVEGVPKSAHGWVDFMESSSGGVNASYPQESWQEISEKFPGNEGLQALHVLIHEYTHIRARVRKEETPGKWNKGVLQGGKTELDLGFVHQSIRDKKVVSESGRALNEAVTEEVALEIMNEYLRRTGDRKLLSSPLIQKLNLSYRPSRYVFDALVETMAIRLEVPRDQVWQGFVAAFLNGNGGVGTLLAEISLQIDKDKDLDSVMGHLLSSFPVTKALHFSDKELKEQVSGIREHNPEALEKAFFRAFDTLKMEGVADALGLRK